MEPKYNVPALERANAVLQLLAEEPLKWKLSELSRHLNISKSTLFSLLQSLERLNWIIRDRSDTYALGPAMGSFGNAYFRQYTIIEEFQRFARPVMQRLQECIQLAELDGNEVLYLSKVEAPAPVQMVSGPGVRLPAYATGLGKAILSTRSNDQIDQLLPAEPFRKYTDYTIDSAKSLFIDIEKVRQTGYATDIQEVVMGFGCIAAPIKKLNGEAAAAVSCSIPIHHWETKKEQAAKEMLQLASQLASII
ncbi:IclR family transcriptional regulator [Paenibacillus sp. GXUN7292]|uniref:IclR family transcriptional regulator n=1 Tax=Paenibacillus sp. GXUN7292 TaxID=3422499 RepID=UPI003D7C91E0